MAANCGYVLGVLLLLGAFSVFAVGYAMPFWSTKMPTFSNLGSVAFEGLILVCKGNILTDLKCTSTLEEYVEIWFQVVRILETACLACMFFACFCAVCCCCCIPSSEHPDRTPETLAGIAGILGLAGVLIYVDKRSTSMIMRAPPQGIVDALLWTLPGWERDWAFYLVVVGSTLSLVSAIVMHINNVTTPRYAWKMD